jgi:hypothetical protein
MHPTIRQQLTQAKIADLNRRADHARLARAARRGRAARGRQLRQRLPVLRVALTRHRLASWLLATPDQTPPHRVIGPHGDEGR